MKMQIALIVSLLVSAAVIVAIRFATIPPCPPINTAKHSYAVARVRDGRLFFLTRSGTWRSDRRQAALHRDLVAITTYGNEFIVVVFDSTVAK